MLTLDQSIFSDGCLLSFRDRVLWGYDLTALYKLLLLCGIIILFLKYQGKNHQQQSTISL